MYKVGLCGNYGDGVTDYNGQTVKTRTITVELARLLGEDKIKTVDTHDWKRYNLLLLFKCFNLSKTCENIIILPGQNGVKVFASLFLILNRLFHRKIHYIVIGGWLPELLVKNEKLILKINKFEGVYVETDSMIKALNKIGLQNARYLSNTKRLDVIKETELIYPTVEPYKLCTFSRVTKEKGIEDAIEAVKYVNKYLGKSVFTLDIYGQVDEKYRVRFEEIKNQFPEYVTYKGVIDSNDSVGTLKNYCALLFPTYYEGEGFAGTIIDAYASGIPVITTNWKYNSEIVRDRVDGFIYDYKNIDELKEILKVIANQIAIVISMKKNCLERAKEYSPEIVIGNFMRNLK